MPDFESVLPFPVCALLFWPAGVIRTVPVLLVVGVIIIAMGQFMLITRTFSEKKGMRLRYLLANETLLILSVFAILGAQFATMRDH